MKTNKIKVRTDQFICTINFGKVMDLPKEQFIELAQQSYICQNTVVLDVADANIHDDLEEEFE